MITKAEKAALWQTIQQQHPEFGAALKAARDEGSDHVAIDRYPARTNGWLMAAIRSARPKLAELIEDRMLPEKAEVSDLFDPAVCVETDDLIAALIEFEDTRATEEVRKAG